MEKSGTGGGATMMAAQKPVRVMLVDDHLMVRRGLSTFLKAFDDLELAGEAEGGKSAVQMCDVIQPDVILMDIVMPDMDGATATRLILQKHPEIKVIALTSYKEEVLVQNALQAGAIGYLLKDISAEELVKAIHAAYSGQATLSPEAAQALVQAAHKPPSPGCDLTNRELSVLALMVEGLNNTQIANRLVVSPSTIKSHVSSILSKLGVSSRSEAVVLAVRKRIIS